MLHLHDLNHVKIGLRWCLVNGQDGINDVRSELCCKSTVELGGERCACDIE